jgi:hypothetical protein
VTTRTPPRTPEIRPPPRWSLWLAALGPLVLWFVYFMAAYLYTEATCEAARWAARGGGFAPDLVLLVGTLVAVAISGGLTVFAYALAGRTARTHDVHDDFLPKLGRVMGLLFTVVLAAHLIPIVLLGVC